MLRARAVEEHPVFESYDLPSVSTIECQWARYGDQFYPSYRTRGPRYREPRLDATVEAYERWKADFKEWVYAEGVGYVTCKPAVIMSWIGSIRSCSPAPRTAGNILPWWHMQKLCSHVGSMHLNWNWSYSLCDWSTPVWPSTSLSQSISCCSRGPQGCLDADSMSSLILWMLPELSATGNGKPTAGDAGSGRLSLDCDDPGSPVALPEPALSLPKRGHYGARSR